MNYSKYNKYTAALENLPLNGELAAKFYKDAAFAPKGYIKLETGNRKGALYCETQSLKYQEKSEYLYKLILLGKKEDRIIFVNAGTLTLDRGGFGGTLYQFNPFDMGAGHNGLHDFYCVVVASISANNKEEDMHPILMCRIPALEGFEGEVEEVDVSAFFRGESVSVKKKETTSSGAASKEMPGKETLAEKESPPPRSRSSHAGKKGAKQKNAEPSQTHSPQTYNHYYNDFIKTCCSQMHQCSSTYEEVSPFGSGIQGISWYKILNVTCLPFINASCQFASADYFRSGKAANGTVHLSCQDLSARYRHFIFGVKLAPITEDSQEPDAEKYYFGIPGLYCKEEQPDGGKSGFRYWQPLSGGTHEKNTYGYWIAAVDAKTGNIEEIPLAENQ